MSDSGSIQQHIDSQHSSMPQQLQFAEAGLAILTAVDIRSTAQALLTALSPQLAAPHFLAWIDHGEVLFEPAEAATPDRTQLVTTVFSGNTSTVDPALTAYLLPISSKDFGAILFAPAPSITALCADSQLLLSLTGKRLSELFSAQRLEASVKELAHAEQLQHALFAITDLASSERDMQSMLHGLHHIIGRLMYAENFFIALYHRSRETLQFIYFADEMDAGMYASDQEIPTADLQHSLTLGLIRYGRAVRGPSEVIAQKLKLPLDTTMGTPSVDFMGVPMRRDGYVVGALVVQSYREGVGYSQSDQAVLSFVADHVINAVERKRSQEELESRVADRTHQLAIANQQLHEQIQERERAAHLQATLYRIAALSNQQQSDTDFYQNIHHAVGELINAENFYIALLSEDKQALHFPYSIDVAGEIRNTRPLSHGVTEYVIRSGETLLTNQEDGIALVERGEISAEEQRDKKLAICWLGAPLLGPDGVMGVVAVQSYQPALVYNAHDADLLTFVSHQIASSVQRRQQAVTLHQLNTELEERVQIRTQELRREITTREQIEAQLKHQVMHDPLTGLPNRVYLRDRLERALSSLQRTPDKHAFALFYLDIDRFKLFNDSLGHGAGDLVLTEVAQRLQECVRTPDIVSRLSGDEFAILLEEGPQPATARKIAQRILARMQEPIQIGERTVQASVSIGIAIGHERYQSIDEVLHDADVALYRAKTSGRQRFVLFDESQQQAAIDVLALELELRKALHSGEFRAYFQPIVRLDDATLCGYEALIRWQHPQRGLLGPGAFLPVAEESGLIEAIDWHMYRLACESAVQLLKEDEYVAINISPRHFQYEDFDQRLLDLLAEVGLPSNKLRIEVTEGALLADPDAVARILERLQAAQIHAALDDFGTGYSSLSYVHRFPLKTIKVDRTFIQDLGRSNERRTLAILEAVLGLGRALDLDVIAEGVETEAQRQQLLEMGCIYTQGFYFGRPESLQHWQNNTPQPAVG